MLLRRRICLVLIAALALLGACAQEPEIAGDAQVEEEHALTFEAHQVQAPTLAPVVEASPTAPPAASPTPSPTPTPTPIPPYRLTKVGDEAGYVKGHDVHMREGPGTTYAIVDTINYHTKLVITGKTDLWYKVTIGEQTGFMLKEFIGVGAIPTPTPKATSKATPKATPKPTSKPQSSAGTSGVEIPQGEKGDYSEADVRLAARLIYAEGKSQTKESFRAMANVLYNRCNSKKFGGSVEKEVYRSGQFSVVKYESFETLSPSNAALQAATDVFNGGVRVLPDGVMYFRSASKGEYWSSSREFYKKIGGNNYYY